MASEGDFRLKTGIIGYNSSILAQKCAKVLDFDQNLHNLLKLMKEAMASAHGVGLAANQLGVSLSAFVYDWNGNSGEIINPQVIRLSGSKVLGEEGCLSVPGLALEVNRASYIRLSGQDREGEMIEATVGGYLARIFQHEIDHLNGTCIADQLKRPDRRQLARHLRKTG